MMVPVRCFTCGNVVGEHWEEFKTHAREGDEHPPTAGALDAELV